MSALRGRRFRYIGHPARDRKSPTFFNYPLDTFQMALYACLRWPLAGQTETFAMKRTTTTMTNTTTTKVAADRWFAPIMAHVCPC